MNEPISDRRLAENEVVFRQHNEQVQKHFDELKAIAKEDRQEHMVPDHDDPLHYYCECSNENCRDRILLTLSRYTDIHQNRSCFVIVPKHDVKQVERVVSREEGYWIVEKYIEPSEGAKTLNPVPLKNV